MRGLVKTHMCVWKPCVRPTCVLGSPMSYLRNYPTVERGPCKGLQRRLVKSVTFPVPRENIVVKEFVSNLFTFLHLLVCFTFLV